MALINRKKNMEEPRDKVGEFLFHTMTAFFISCFFVFSCELIMISRTLKLSSEKLSMQLFLYHITNYFWPVGGIFLLSVH